MGKEKEIKKEKTRAEEDLYDPFLYEEEWSEEEEKRSDKLLDKIAKKLGIKKTNYK